MTPANEFASRSAFRPRRRRWRRLSLLLLLVAFAAVLYAGAALTCQPAWYQPLSIDYQRLEGDKSAQHHLENKISAALNENRSVRFTLDEARLNRWIAARDELWPAELPSIEPFSHPQVLLESGNRVRLAARVTHAGMQVVLSATFQVDLQPDGLVVTCDSVQAGALPAPRTLLEKAARKLAHRLDLPDHAVDNGRVTLTNEWLWPNGKRPCRISELSITDGELHARLEPL